MRGNTTQAIINPVTYLRGPCSLVAWNLHISCNLSCAMDIHACMPYIATRATHMGTQVQLTCIITYKNVSNLVHNCESNAQ